MTEVIQELKAIQHAHGYLPAGELEGLARRLRVPLYTLQGLASFYPHFRLSPPPRLAVRVCRDLSCRLAGAAAAEREARAAAGDHADVEVEGVSCLGRCDRPVALAIGDRILGGLDPGQVGQQVRDALAGRPMADPGGARALSDFPSLARTTGEQPFAILRQVLASADPVAVIARLKESGLKGMGGAGFPTGFKWELVRQAPGSPKYVVCNADESEPGTFKDREILERHADQVLEGMAIGGYTIGAARGIVYLRHEYAPARAALAEALGRMRAAGLAGDNLAGTGFSFAIEIFDSPGGYICGEETALLEALEGKRAEPRNKPPFPGTHGLWGKPTLINNVETFAFSTAILRHGPDWFSAAGQNGARGRKLLALSGDVERPGVYDVPLGIPADELIATCGGGLRGGRPLKAFSPGGASSGFLPASLASTPLDFAALARVGSMLGSGAVVAVAEGSCMVDLALNLSRFFRHESCGKCVPCRAGTDKIVSLLAAAAAGRGTPEDLALFDALAEVMRDTSICGLGQAAPYPVLSLLKYWRDELEDHLLRRHCPSGACQEAGGRA